MNFKGAPGAPIRFINCGGLVEVVNDSYAPVVQFVDSQHFVLSGSGDSAYLYGFSLNNTGTSAGSTLNVMGRSSDCELERIEVSNHHFAGIVVKQDPGCDTTFYRGNFTMYNIAIHDSYVHNTGGEIMYIGNSFWGNGVTVTCNGRKKVVYPHEIHGLHIHHNRVDQTGCEGVQYGCAPNALVHHNLITNAGTSPFARYQNNGLQVDGRSSGLCYNTIVNNVSGNGFVIVGYAGDVKVYNNVITNISDIGIFADERTGWLPDTEMTLINNTIIGCRADGIKLYSETSKNTIANNVIASVGAGRYITFGQGAVATQLSNVKSARPDTLGFVDIARADFRLTKNSFLVNREMLRIRGVF